MCMFYSIRVYLQIFVSDYNTLGSILCLYKGLGEIKRILTKMYLLAIYIVLCNYLLYLIKKPIMIRTDEKPNCKGKSRDITF